MDSVVAREYQRKEVERRKFGYALKTYSENPNTAQNLQIQNPKENEGQRKKKKKKKNHHLLNHNNSILFQR